MSEFIGASVPAERRSLADRVKDFLSRMSGGVVLGGEQYVGIFKPLDGSAAEPQQPKSPSEKEESYVDYSGLWPVRSDGSVIGGSERLFLGGDVSVADSYLAELVAQELAEDPDRDLD